MSTRVNERYEIYNFIIYEKSAINHHKIPSIHSFKFHLVLFFLCASHFYCMKYETIFVEGKTFFLFLMMLPLLLSIFSIFYVYYYYYFHETKEFFKCFYICLFFHLSFSHRACIHTFVLVRI